jgi:hypothetical protein
VAMLNLFGFLGYGGAMGVVYTEVCTIGCSYALRNGMQDFGVQLDEAGVSCCRGGSLGAER